MTRRRTAYLVLLILALSGLVAIIVLFLPGVVSVVQSPSGQAGGQIISPLDALARQVRESGLTEQLIANRKQALADEYALVTQGKESEADYISHCQAVMQLTGDDPARCVAPFLPPQPPPPGPSPVPTIAATIEPALSMTDAWGTDIKIETIPLTYGIDYSLYCNIITPDGQYLVCEAMSLDFGSEPTRNGGTRPGKVMLVDVHTHQVAEIRTLPRNDTQAMISYADDRSIVWTEAVDVMGFSDAMIFTYDRTTHALNSQAPANVKHPTVGDPESHGVVVWAEPLSSTSGVGKVAIRKLDRSTGESVTLDDNAFGGPTISWPYVSWLQVRESTPQMITFSLVVLNLQTGVKKTLRDPSTGRYCINGDTVVWATRPGEVVLTDVDETSQRVLMRGSYGENIDGLTMNDRLIAWNSYESAQVWDRVLGRLVNIPGGGLRNIFSSGNYFVWQSLGANSNSAPANTATGATINVLDTSSLRK